MVMRTTTRPWFVGLICVITLLVSACYSASAPNAATSDVVKVQIGDLSASQDQHSLIQARMANEDAQAKYYTSQTQRAKGNSFWRNAKESPAAVMAGLAAVVSLLSFWFNYTATRRNQEDMQFYEALKRFGDSSVALRCGSVGLLRTMASRDQKNKKAYLYTTLEQLITGLLFEKDSVVLMRIRQGIQSLFPAGEKEIFELIAGANLDLQCGFVQGIADYLGINEIEHVQDVSEELWNATVAWNAHYDRPVIESLVKSHGWVTFEDRLRIKARQASNADNGRVSRADELGQELRIAADRLAESVKVLAHAIRASDSPGLFLGCHFLVDADLHDTNLEQAVLTGASIQGALFRGARLHNTKIAGVHFNKASDFGGTNWWAANYYLGDQEVGVDESLLSYLTAGYTLEMAKHSRDAHPSVRKFCEVRNSEIKRGSSIP